MRPAELSVACDIGSLLFFASWLWLMLRRRDLWLRFTAAETALWKRLHLPPRFRRFGQGRGIVYFAAFGIALSVILLIASIGLCIYIRHHPQPDKLLQPARGDALGLSRSRGSFYAAFPTWLSFGARRRHTL